MEIKLYGDYFTVHFSSRFKAWIFKNFIGGVKVNHISKLGECGWITIPEGDKATFYTPMDIAPGERLEGESK